MPPVSLHSAGAVVLMLAVSACSSPEQQQPTGSHYLFVWSGDDDHADSDFLAVVDADPSSTSYGRVLNTLPVGAVDLMPHHTEYEFPHGDTLFANGFKAGRSFLFDLSDPVHPSVAGEFGTALGFGFPHSFARLASGHVLATFQSQAGAYVPPGGLVELGPDGAAIRAASAATPDVDSVLTWPYSLAVVPRLSRAVVSMSEMGMGTDYAFHDTRHVQVWDTDSLTLVASVPLPPDSGGHHLWPSEPRVLWDGTVYVVTFMCGLYRMTGVESDHPSAELVHTFPVDVDHQCGVPVVVGPYWLQTVPKLPGIVAVDASDPAHPVEASRLVFDGRYQDPHWLAADRAGSRVVVTGESSIRRRAICRSTPTSVIRAPPATASGSTARPGRTAKRDRHGCTARCSASSGMRLQHKRRPPGRPDRRKRSSYGCRRPGGRTSRLLVVDLEDLFLWGCRESALHPLLERRHQSAITEALPARFRIVDGNDGPAPGGRPGGMIDLPAGKSVSVGMNGSDRCFVLLLRTASEEMHHSVRHGSAPFR